MVLLITNGGLLVRYFSAAQSPANYRRARSTRRNRRTLEVMTDDGEGAR